FNPIMPCIGSAVLNVNGPVLSGSGGLHVSVALRYHSVNDVTMSGDFFGVSETQENSKWALSVDAFLQRNWDNNDLVFYRGGEYERSMRYEDGIWYDEVHCATADLIWSSGKAYYRLWMPSGARIRYASDTGRIDRHISSFGTRVDYVYDTKEDRGLLVEIKMPSIDGRSVQFQYDEAKPTRLISIVYPDSGVLSLEYDSVSGVLDGVFLYRGVRLWDNDFEYAYGLMDKVYSYDMSSQPPTRHLIADYEHQYDQEEEEWVVTGMKKAGDSAYLQEVQNEIEDASPGSFRRIRPDGSIYEVKITADGEDQVTRRRFYDAQETPVGPVSYQRQEPVYHTIQ
ncbi:MAG TPA: hypothetical protein PKH07_20795, partial [bacterium]|nr:hypothetical protein [bacterium]